MAVLMPTTRPRIEQRPARVAGIERGGVLHDVLHQPPGLPAHGPADGADHAGRDGRLEAEGVSHRDHQLADLQAVGIAQFGPGQIAGHQPQQGQVGRRIVADQLGVERIAIGGDGPQLLPPADDMAVG